MKKSILTIFCLFFVNSCMSRKFSDAETKLIGGTPAAPQQFPAAVQLLGCTATKVGTNVLILAAHCVVDEDAGTVLKSAKVGQTVVISWGVDFRSARSLKATIAKVFVHPAYLEKAIVPKSKVISEAPDVALIFINEQLADLDTARLSPLEITNKSDVIATGYGCETDPNHQNAGGDFVSDEHKLFGRLKFAPLSVDKVSPSYLYKHFVTNEFGDVVLSLCNGDSGGALYLNEVEKDKQNPTYLTVVGINSYRDAASSAFTRIDSKTKDAVWACIDSALKNSTLPQHDIRKTKKGLTQMCQL